MSHRDHKPEKRVAIVVPCFNEENRLQKQAFVDYSLAHSDVDFCFVDDGSSDGTHALLQKIQQANPDHFFLHNLNTNLGKAEAVRHGMLFMHKAGPYEFIGYWDADLATPLEAIIDFLLVFQENPQLQMVYGARVLRMGSSIKRNPARHYLGRIFATFASMILGLGIYDTQCGAKLFRSNLVPSLFKNPFKSRWFFDVELTGLASKHFGLDDIHQRLYELPLKQWHDIGNSKLTIKKILLAPIELLYIWKAIKADSN